MVIDAHSHIFPDFLAEKAISSLERTAGIKTVFDGTKAGLITLMDADGIDKAVVLNTVTNARQVENVNAFAVSLLREERLIPFCSIHPHTENPYEKLKALKDSGIKGVKLHPDYLGVMFDSEELSPLLAAICECDLPLTIHAGYDPVSPNKVHAPPDAILSVLNRFPDITLIVAHLGGIGFHDETASKLCGRNLYFDTAFCCERTGVTALQAKRIFERHPAERILFGSDAPWAKPSEILPFLLEAGLQGEDLELVTHKNAERLLSL